MASGPTVGPGGLGHAEVVSHVGAMQERRALAEVSGWEVANFQVANAQMSALAPEGSYA